MYRAIDMANLPNDASTKEIDAGIEKVILRNFG